MAFTPQLTTSGGITPEFQLWIDRSLLEHAIQLTVMDQFCMNGTLPGGMGATQARYLKQGQGDATQVQTLTEGTPIAVSRALTLTGVTVQLVQYGEVIVVSDVLLKTQLVDTMKFATQTLGEDCALKMDSLQRDEVAINNVTAGNIRYAQQITTFALLGSGTAAGGSLIINDILDAMTRLENTRAPRIQGSFISIICPQQRRDLFKDQTYLTPAQYGDPSRIFKGEIGEFFNCRFVLSTNPFIEAIGTQFTYAAGGAIFTAIVTGMQAWGFIKLAAMDPGLSSSETKPAIPKIIIVNTPDHADALGQQTIVGWKAFNAAKLLDPTWCVTIRSRTQFV